MLFASLLGYNPVQSLLGHQTLSQLKPSDASYLTGHSFFPSLISQPFHDGLTVAFGFAIVVCLVAAGASWLIGEKFVHADDEHETPLDFAQPEAGEPELESEADVAADAVSRPAGAHAAGAHRAEPETSRT